MISRRQLFFFGSGAFITAGLHSCTLSSTTSSTSTSQLIPMKFGINPWPGAMPFKVAEEQKFFAANGLDLKLILFPSISQMMDAFNAGKIDATLIDPGTLLISATNGVAQKFVMVTDFSNGADAIVVAPSIKSIEEFKDKRISVELGSIGHFLLLTALKQAGLSTDDVKLMNQPADAALISLMADKTEIAVSYEPFISQAIKQGKGKILFSTKDASIAPDVLSVRQEFLDRYSNAVPQLIKTWYQTLDYRKRNLEAAIAVEAKALGVTPGEFKTYSDGVRLVTDPKEVVSYMTLDQSSAPMLKQTAMDVSGFLTSQKRV